MATELVPRNVLRGLLFLGLLAVVPTFQFFLVWGLIGPVLPVLMVSLFSSPWFMAPAVFYAVFYGLIFAWVAGFAAEGMLSLSMRGQRAALAAFFGLLLGVGLLPVCGYGGPGGGEKDLTAFRFYLAMLGVPT
jgi:hypothetical protein